MYRDYRPGTQIPGKPVRGKNEADRESERRRARRGIRRTRAKIRERDDDQELDGVDLVESLSADIGSPTRTCYYRAVGWRFGANFPRY